jgi:hypothetical protein
MQALPEENFHSIRTPIDAPPWTSTMGPAGDLSHGGLNGSRVAMDVMLR